MNEERLYSKLLKRKVLLTIFLLMFILLSIIFSFLLYNETKFTKEVESAFNKGLDGIVEHIVKEHIIDTYMFKANEILEIPKVKEYLKIRDRKSLHKLVNPLWKRMTKKNPYLKIMLFHSPDGKAFLRMHKPKTFGDKLSNIRKMIKEIHKERRVLIGYETGKYSTVYRIIVPIFDKNEYLGALDFGINPNYFIEKLNKTIEGEGVLFVNKKDLKLFKRDFNFSIGDYQLQSTSTKQILLLLNYVKKHCNSLLIDNYRCKINGNYYIVHIKNLTGFKGEIKAKLLFFQDITEHKKFYNSAVFYIITSAWILLIVIFIILNYSFNYFISKLKKLHNISMEKEKEAKKKLIFKEKYLKTILDSNENIIITTIEGEELDRANSIFFEFFNYKNIEEFKKKHSCICDFFEAEKDYVTKYVNSQNWLKYILNNRDKTHKVLMKKDNQNYIFKVNANLMEFDEKSRSVVSFTDITEIEEYKESLENRVKNEIEKRRKQEQLLIQQSKMSSLAEIMSSIAHQWRQPLNVIGLAIQGLNIKIDLEEKITEEDVDDLNESVMKQIKYMSNTIDDFRNFFRPSKGKKEFDIKKAILNVEHLIKAQLENNSINIYFEFNEKNSFLVLGYANEFEHIILNIISNAKDAIESQIKKDKIVDNGLIQIKLNYLESKAVIEIIDNGGGIKDEIIDKIFDPYFTTKFEAMGTGIGLYMAKIMIEKNMRGKIYAQNFESGSKFIIEIQK